MTPIDYYYDFSSPYAYLACEAVEELAAKHGTTVRWRPFLLGGLFRLVELDVSEGPPIAKASANKRRIYLLDMARYADLRGLPLQWPSEFPKNTVRPLRVMLQVDDAEHRGLAQAIFKAYWGEDRDIADPAVLSELIVAADLDPAPLLAGCQDPAVKGRLIANTQALFDLGGCGAPSFVVDGHLFWGQDRLPLVEAVLGGWRPPNEPPHFKIRL
jgi:2-hydroxychromene-2-carboxylate isomerase